MKTHARTLFMWLIGVFVLITCVVLSQQVSLWSRGAVLTRNCGYGAEEFSNQFSPRVQLEDEIERPGAGELLFPNTFMALSFKISSEGSDCRTADLEKATDLKPLPPEVINDLRSYVSAVVNNELVARSLLDKENDLSSADAAKFCNVIACGRIGRATDEVPHRLGITGNLAAHSLLADNQLTNNIIERMRTSCVESRETWCDEAVITGIVTDARVVGLRRTKDRLQSYSH